MLPGNTPMLPLFGVCMVQVTSRGGRCSGREKLPTSTNGRPNLRLTTIMIGNFPLASGQCTCRSHGQRKEVRSLAISSTLKRFKLALGPPRSRGTGETYVRMPGATDPRGIAHAVPLPSRGSNATCQATSTSPLALAEERDIGGFFCAPHFGQRSIKLVGCWVTALVLSTLKLHSASCLTAQLRVPSFLQAGKPLKGVRMGLTPTCPRVMASAMRLGTAIRRQRSPCKILDASPCSQWTRPLMQAT